MKHQNFTIILIISLFLNSNLVAQWESLGDNIIPQNHRVWSIKVAPDRSVWAVATFDAFPPTNQIPKVFRSTDEGNTWSSSEIPEATSEIGWDISPIDSMNAFIALDSEGLYQTSDGGLNWNEVTTYPYRVLVVHFFNEQEGLALGTDGFARIISLTADGGNNWIHLGGQDWLEPNGTSLPTFDPNEGIGLTFSINSFYDYRGNVFMIGNSNGNYWISTDKGYNWERRETPLTNLGLILSNIAMKDENTFMVAGDTESGTFTGVTTVNFTTKDGGNTWIEGSSGLTCAASHYIPNSDSVFVMVGHNNFGWGSEGTAISYDYGENWEILDNTSIIAVDFVDENTGYGSCCNNFWQTANGQIHKWDFDLPTSTFEAVKSNKVEIMPNPVNTNLLIRLNNEFQSQELTIEIISVSGKILSSNKVQVNEQINIGTTDLPVGFYSLRIKGGQKIITKKFIKE
jgi:photosystem II stability/assembly factor-like uncharacterized protein